MQKNIKAGVTAVVLPTLKFKTVRIEIHFLKNAEIADLSQRTLISSILETSSAKYDNQVKLTHELSDMLGAGFGSGAVKRGRVHDVGFSMLVANEKFVNEPNLIHRGFDFLKEIIFNPLTIKGEAFDEKVFKRQKANLLNYIAGNEEDKQYYAMQKIRSLTYGAKTLAGLPNYGEVKDVKELNNGFLYRKYLEMIQKDAVVITVSGDIDEAQILQEIEQLPIEPRKIQLNNIITKYDNLFEPRKEVETQDVKQAKLNISYNLPAYYTTDNFYTAIVFNALFGGSPQSKLFLNVREKASLAYYASSSLGLANGMMTVQTGINQKNYEKAFEIIQQQLTAIQKGEFSEEILENIKKGIVSDYIAGLDNQRMAHRQALSNYLLKKDLTSEQWIKYLKQVNKDDVVKLANDVVLRAQYFLKGE